MKIKIVGKNVKITDGMESKIKEKLGKLEKYEILKDSTPCNILIRTVKDDQIIEVTLHLDGGKVIRAEKRANDLYVAIDMIEETLVRQVRKEKEKTLGKKRPVQETTEIDEIENLNIPAIVKEKTVLLTMTTPDEAIEEMEALDHDFHLFRNAENGKVCVLYRRKDNDYGMITEY